MISMSRLPQLKFLSAMSAAVAVAFVAAAPVAHADEVDNYVQKVMAERKIPGMSIAVLRDREVVKEKVYGVASVELNVPTSRDTVYNLASMTKVFTGTAIMLLVQDGSLSLDDPITKFLPDLPAKWSHVTIRHCLSHTSGLPDAILDDINATAMTGDRSDLFHRLSDAPIKPEGTGVAYNQTGYVILGLIIEKVSGLPYEKFMRERVLTPIGMTHANFGDEWNIIPGRTTLYTALDITNDHAKLLVKDGRPVVREGQIYNYGSKYFPTLMTPAASLNASVDDLVKWEQTLYDSKLLSPTSEKTMMTPFKLQDGKDGDFGLSFLISPLGKFPTVSYGGGAASWRLAVPEKHLTVIVLTNLQGSQPEMIAANIAGLYDKEIEAEVKKL